LSTKCKEGYSRSKVREGPLNIVAPLDLLQPASSLGSTGGARRAAKQEEHEMSPGALLATSSSTRGTASPFYPREGKQPPTHPSSIPLLFPSPISRSSQVLNENSHQNRGGRHGTKVPRVPNSSLISLSRFNP
jgi:hypothetical protein